MPPPSPDVPRRYRPLPFLLLAAGVCAALWLVTLLSRPLAPALPGLAAQIAGAFPPGGQYAGDPLEHAAEVRLWGSWAGDDRRTGALTLGPFPAPRSLRFAVGGYPTRPGNEVYLELVSTGARLPVRFASDVGERWRIVDVPVPPAWVGNQVALHARDDATDLGGWLALSEPVRGGRGTGAEFFETLTAWSVNGLLLGLLWVAALRRLADRSWLAPHWMPLVAAGFVALAGYAAFWVYFAHPLLGKIFSGSLLAWGLADAVRRRPTLRPPHPEAFALAPFFFAIGLFYLGLLHLFPSSLDFDSLAANRFREGLPGDNTLPRNVANDLFDGHPLRQPNPEWRSSDRPPLQSGWLLLTRPVTATMNLDERTANGTAAIWLQSLWIFGAYGLLRSLGLRQNRAAAWLAVLALSGFFAQNTVFTWPKLSAAAFGCGAFALWILPRHGPNPADRRASAAFIPLGGLLAALAWLSHGGVAFSLLGLLPWLLTRAWRDPRRPWVLAVAVFALLAVPWFAYQKFYDPPGDRLLRMHLGGQAGMDSRGVWQTVRDAYGALSWSQIAAHKQANLRLQLGERWSEFWKPSRASAPQRRNDEFFLLPRGLTWWWLGLAGLPVALIRGRLRTTWRRHPALAGWTVLTVILWCLLMFSGGQAVIHQGSYAVMLALFALLSAWCELAGRWMLPLVGALQAVSFTTTWAEPNATVHGPLNVFALGALAASLGLAGLALWRRPRVVVPGGPHPLRAAPGDVTLCKA